MLSSVNNINFCKLKVAEKSNYYKLDYITKQKIIWSSNGNKKNKEYRLYYKHWMKKMYINYFCYTFILLSYLLIFSNYVNINVLFFLHKYTYYIIFISEAIYLFWLGLKILLLNNEKIEKVKINYISKNKDFVGMDKINVKKLLFSQWGYIVMISVVILLPSTIPYGAMYKDRTNEFAELKITNSKKICISNPTFNYVEFKTWVDMYVSYIIDKNMINTPLDSELYNNFIKQMLNVDDSILTNKQYYPYDLEELNNKIKIINDNVHNQHKNTFCKK